MTKRDIPLFKVFMARDVEYSLSKVLHSGYIGQGPKVDELEGELSNYFSTPYVSALNSATSGLHLALRLVKDFYGDGVRDEIITTPLTCTATNFPILANDLKIKWADLDPNTCNIDLEDVRRKVNEKTLGIMVVHWGGLPVDLNQLKSLQLDTKRMFGFDLPIIEDCAHAFGSKYYNQMIGASGNFCVFSFQAIKHLTTGDGGLLISPNEEIHEKAKLLRWFGLDRTSSQDFRCTQNIADWGYKFHMNDIAASIGLSNFKYMPDVVKRHHENEKWMRDKLQDMSPALKVMSNDPNFYSSSWIMTLLVENRDDFMAKMKSCGIGCSRVHDRNDKHKCLEKFRSFLPKTDYVCSHMCCIPCGWYLTEEDREFIVDTIKEGW